MVVLLVLCPAPWARGQSGDAEEEMRPRAGEIRLRATGGQAAPGEKSVTLWDFMTYVRHRVKELTGGAQNPHVPFIHDFDTDAALVAGA